MDECFLAQLVSALLKKGKGEEGKVKVDTWQIRAPTLVDDVAMACRKLAERRFFIYLFLFFIFYFFILFVVYCLLA